MLARGSIVPASIRPTVDCGTPARAARPRWLRFLQRRALRRSVPGSFMEFMIADVLSPGSSAPAEHALIAYALSGLSRRQHEASGAERLEFAWPWRTPPSR